MTDRIMGQLQAHSIPFRDRRGTLPTRPNATPYQRRRIDQIQWLVYHYTGTEARPTVESVASYHTGSGCPTEYPAIAYWAYIDEAGIVNICHDVEAVSWAQGTGSPTVINGVGSNNWYGLSICFAGMSPNRAQQRSLKWLTASVDESFGISLIRKPHSMVSRDPTGKPLTECPGENWSQWLDF